MEFTLWLPAYIIGFLGILTHIITKVQPGKTPLDYVKENWRDTTLSVISLIVFLYVWAIEGMDFLGFKQGEPILFWSFMLGYFGQSFLGHVIMQAEKRLFKKNDNA